MHRPWEHTYVRGARAQPSGIEHKRAASWRAVQAMKGLLLLLLLMLLMLRGASLEVTCA